MLSVDKDVDIVKSILGSARQCAVFKLFKEHGNDQGFVNYFMHTSNVAHACQGQPSDVVVAMSLDTSMHLT